MFGLSRTVLFLSDDAVSVYTPVAGRYDLVGEVEWGNADLSDDLAQILTKKGHSRPVLILYDMVEQYYRKEMVPKVAVLDQQRVLMRKLVATFPNYPVRASAPLRLDKSAKGKTGVKESDRQTLEAKPYLFVAIPQNDQMIRVIEAVREAGVSAKDIYLLPIESVGLVERLSRRVSTGNTAGKWTILLTQHRGGGLRQIVIKDGELALTRLTPVVDTDIEPHLWVNEVAQEFTATMGYLSRFGYTAGAELEVIAVGGAQALRQLGEAIKVDNYYPLSVSEAARILGLRLHADATTRHADALHAAWLAQKLSFVLPLRLPSLSFLSRVRTVGIAASWILGLGALGALGYGFYQGYELLSAINTLENKKLELVKLEEEYNAEIERKKSYNIDVKLVQGSIAILDALEQNKIDTVSFLRRLSESMNSDFKFDSIEMGFTEIEQQNPDPLAIAAIKKKVFEAKLAMSFPASYKPELGNKAVSDLRDRIAKKMPDFDVVVSQAVQDLTYGSSYEYEAGGGAGAAASQSARLTAAITLRQKEQKEVVTP